MSDTWNYDTFTSALSASLVEALKGSNTLAALAAAVAQAAEEAESICGGRPMACAAGCPHCCVLNVAALLPEALLIADWIGERLGKPELDQLKRSLAGHRSSTRWMEDEERVAKHALCPFVDSSGSCLIHPVRPLACRAVTSLDSGSCREALAPVIADEARLVPTDLLRQSVYDAVFKALAGAISVRGLDHRSIELGSGVLAFLEHPEYRDSFLIGGRLPSELWR